MSGEVTKKVPQDPATTKHGEDGGQDGAHDEKHVRYGYLPDDNYLDRVQVDRLIEVRGDHEKQIAAKSQDERGCGVGRF